MWFIFPQFDGLAFKRDVEALLAIKSVAEARAYLDHPILGPRLLECAEAVVHSQRPVRRWNVRFARTI